MSNVLVIGTGGCGGKLADTFMSILDKKVGIKNTYGLALVNSHIDEMLLMPHSRVDVNCLAIDGNGTGGERKKAKESIVLNKSRCLNFFKERIGVVNYQSAILLCSADGGFGSGSIPTISSVLKLINKEMKVMVVSAMPKISENKLRLGNACELSKDLIELRAKNVINNVLFLDNNKMNEETTFNTQAMNTLIDSLELHGGGVDQTDMFKINTAGFYKIILPLDHHFNSVASSLDNTINNSVFVVPDELKSRENNQLIECTHLGAIFNKEYFNKEEWKSIFYASQIDKSDYAVAHPKENPNPKSMIVASGFSLPDSFLNMIKSQYVSLVNKEKNKKKADSTFTFDMDFEDDSVFETGFDNEDNNENEMSALDLREALDDDFWDNI